MHYHPTQVCKLITMPQDISVMMMRLVNANSVSSAEQIYSSTLWSTTLYFSDPQNDFESCEDLRI